MAGRRNSVLAATAWIPEEAIAENSSRKLDSSSVKPGIIGSTRTSV
jgi:hypothetical protein